jgi:hypothetical protein
MEFLQKCSGLISGTGRLSAGSAESDTLEAAQQTNERAALNAGIPLGGALLPAACPTLHCIVLVEFAHQTIRK